MRHASLPSHASLHFAGTRDLADQLPEPEPLDVQQIWATESGDFKTDIRRALRKMVELSQDQTFVFPLSSFVQENLGRPMPMRFQPSFQSLTGKLATKVASLVVRTDYDGHLSLATMIASVFEIIQKALPDTWIEFAALVPIVMANRSSSQNAQQASYGVFMDERNIDRFLDLRVSYAIELLGSCVSGPDAIATKDYGKVLQLLRQHIDKVSRGARMNFNIVSRRQHMFCSWFHPCRRFKLMFVFVALRHTTGVRIFQGSVRHLCDKSFKRLCRRHADSLL